MKRIFLSGNKISSLKIVLSITLLIFCSKVTVPFYPVPVTLQMFAIYLLSFKLSPKESFASIFLWLGRGICGVPVFAPNIIGNFFLDQRGAI
jgi:biotin transport system substrate-specific component